jgi:RNA polymerase sigma-70 factor (ECF subfamily)
MAAETAVKPIRVVALSNAASADWALVQECAPGSPTSEQACTRLVSDHQRMVYQLALHLLGDPQEALDLSQEVFLKVFRTLPQFRGQSTLRTWIYRIVVNQA